MLKAIIFDFFGVFCTDVGWRWFDKNLSPTDKQWFSGLLAELDLGKLTKTEFFEKLGEEKGVTAATIEEGFQAELAINAEVVDIVRSLRHAYKIGLLSNANAEMLSQILKEAGIEHDFDAITISSKLGFKKPDTAIFKVACESLGVALDEALFIDDRESNTEAARTLGMQAITYRSAAELREKLAVKSNIAAPPYSPDSEHKGH